jgi:hypothetical protein
MNPAAEHLKDEAERAVELLSDLCKPKPPQKPLGDLNPKAIKHCRVSFYIAQKVCTVCKGALLIVSLLSYDAI